MTKDVREKVLFHIPCEERGEFILTSDITGSLFLQCKKCNTKYKVVEMKTTNCIEDNISFMPFKPKNVREE